MNWRVPLLMVIWFLFVFTASLAIGTWLGFVAQVLFIPFAVIGGALIGWRFGRAA